MRKLASKTYTDNLTSPPEEVVRRHRLEIAAHFYPGALISHRSALEGGNISPGGKFHLTVSEPWQRCVTSRIGNPSLARPRTTGGRHSDPLGEGKELFTSSQARAVLENMQIARAHGHDEPKTLSPEELERWIDRYLRIFGVGWLDQLRQQAGDLASRFGWHASNRNSTRWWQRSKANHRATSSPPTSCVPVPKGSHMIQNG